MSETIQLSAATIEYEDTGGAGAPVVLLHGLLMDSSLWGEVVPTLLRRHRCIVPTLPLGGHRHALHEGADTSPVGLARLVLELLERLELRDVILVGNDTGGALVQLAASTNSERIAAIVLVSCDAFENFPPGVTGKALVLSGRLPVPLFRLFMQQMRLKPLRRLPIAFGWLTKRGDRATRRWLGPLLSRGDICRDTTKVLRGIHADRDCLNRAAEQLGSFPRPALIVWASEDKVMPPAHARRLLERIPDARVVEIADSYTLIPLDQPRELATAMMQFSSTLPGAPTNGAEPARPGAAEGLPT